MIGRRFFFRNEFQPSCLALGRVSSVDGCSLQRHGHQYCSDADNHQGGMILLDHPVRAGGGAHQPPEHRGDAADQLRPARRRQSRRRLQGQTANTYLPGVVVPVLQEALDMKRSKASGYILAIQDGQAYTDSGSRAMWNRVMDDCAKADGFCFTTHDLCAYYVTEKGIGELDNDRMLFKDYERAEGYDVHNTYGNRQE